MKHALSISLIALLVLCAGCARYHITQRDSSTNEDGTPGREITTSIKASAWLSSAQSISNLKATQTDKTQTLGASSTTQQGATNIVDVLNALANVIGALPK